MEPTSHRMSNGETKRKTDGDPEDPQIQTKRQRLASQYDEGLSKLLEALADESPATRVAAAESLLELQRQHAGDAEWQARDYIYRRLVRGLCSARKAARLGFYMTLCEYLKQSDEQAKDPAQYMSFLHQHTQPDKLASSKERRDHELGQMSGYSAYLASGIPFESSSVSSSSSNSGDDRLQIIMNAMYKLAQKSPWLREEWALALAETMAFLSSGSDPNRSQTGSDWASSILRVLQDQDEARSGEGLVIWLRTKQAFPKMKMPKNIWHHRDPWTQKEIPNVTKILKGLLTDASRQIHFAIPVVLENLLSESREAAFRGLWQDLVEEGLFAAGASAERKSTGLQLARSVVRDCPQWALIAILKPNLLSCLANQGKKDRFLHGEASRFLKGLAERGSRDSAEIIVESLVGYSIHFDKITNSKAVSTLISTAPADSKAKISAFYVDSLQKPPKSVSGARKALAEQLIDGFLRSESQSPASSTPQSLTIEILERLAHLSYFAAETGETDQIRHDDQIMIHGKLCQALSYLLSSSKAQSSQILFSVINMIYTKLRKFEASRLDAEKSRSLQKIIKKSWQELDPTADDGKTQARRHTYRILISIAILEALNGDNEAFELVEELTERVQDLGSFSASGDDTESVPALIEIILSMTSKQSSLHRRLAELAFTGIVSDINAEALDLMLDVLSQKESLAGQQELFEQNKEGEDEVDDDNANEREDDDGSEDGSVKTPSESSAEDEDEDDDDDGKEDNYAALDQALSDLLQSSKQADSRAPKVEGNGEDDDESDDVSMTDSQMMELEPSLAAVFKEKYPDLSSSQANGKSKPRTNDRRSQQKSAKQNIVNFKNRVLDLVNILTKERYADQLTLGVISALLELQRTSGSKQLTERANGILVAYFDRAKSKGLPKAQKEAEELLGWVFVEALSFPSKLHASSCNRASLFLCRMILEKESDADGKKRQLRWLCTKYSEMFQAWALGDRALPDTWFREFPAWIKTLAL